MRIPVVRLRVPLIVLLPALAPSGNALAHGGGLDAQGCHHNRRTSDYHCHRGAGSNAPKRLVPRRLTPSGSASRRASGPFANCAAARAAGAAPVHRGDPGYGRQLDRDNDGVGCE